MDKVIIVSVAVICFIAGWCVHDVWMTIDEAYSDARDIFGKGDDKKK